VKSIQVNILRIRYVEDVLESPTLFSLASPVLSQLFVVSSFNITFDASAKGRRNQVFYEYVQYEQGQ
jgi:hypothetical protein